MNDFKGKQFKKDFIIVAVGYYLRYNLSYREVQKLLYDRGINVCHTTIYRWVQEYSKVLYYLWKKKNRQSFYIMENGRNQYQANVPQVYYRVCPKYDEL